MSMPTKGKHHHPAHHHHQPHHTHMPSQHIIGVNISQSTASSLSHSPHIHYNSAVLNNSSRFVSHPGSDFHVPGQNFSAQPGGQVGGIGSSVVLSSGRGPHLGGMQSITQSTSTLTTGSLGNQSQTGGGSNIQSQSSQSLSSNTAIVHNSPSSEMSKPTHLPTQPPIQPPVYVQNPNRSVAQQNYYSTAPRAQQSRSINHRSTQSGNQTQVVGISGGAGSQTTTLYPHPSITMQPSTVYVQNQVSGLHTNPHQQNVYSMNNQMPMQYSGPPQRHQTHQSQYSYQSYQAHALLATSNIFGYSAGAQHPGFFYHQAPSTQLNLARTSTNSINNTTQHLAGPLAATQGATIVTAGNIQQPTQQPQTMHAISIPISPTDVYPGFNGGSNNLSTRSKKPRTKAITDIVDPFTGKNISAEIYKDDFAAQSGEKINRESAQLLNSKAELAADFAARVAILASESASSVLVTERENTDSTSQMTNEKAVTKIIDNTKDSSCNSNNANERLSSFESQNSMQDLEIQSVGEIKLILNDDIQAAVSLPSTTLSEELMQKNILVTPQEEEIDVPQKVNELMDLQRHEKPEETLSTLNVNTEIHLTNLQSTDIKTSDNQICDNLSLVLPDNNAEINKKSTEEEFTKPLDIDNPNNDIHQRCFEGKNMQKQKNKSKVKIRELNRRGAEKEGTDMDAFIKIELNQDSISQKDTKKEENIELTKDIKEKDNYESRKEKEFAEDCSNSFEKNASSADVNKKENFNNKESSLEDSLRNISITIDAIDYICSSKIEMDSVPSIVAQKNEENCKVSDLCNIPNDEISTELANSLMKMKLLKTGPCLKYAYSDDQWSPINTNGKKVYGREFLMKLQNDPNSKIKPLNLPDLDVVLKDSTKIRSSVDIRFKDPSIGRHDSLFPGFAKSSLNSKVLPPNKKNHSLKPKVIKPNAIHLSLSVREDVKLRETENAWKPTRLVQVSNSEKESKTEILYKKVRSVLNKLTPQNLQTLVSQVLELEIDTQERLQGVIDLVFEKAVDEPNFSKAYAEMCKALSNIQVAGADAADTTTANFRKLILTRCQAEFEKNTVDESARNEKLREIEECTDPKKKKELLLIFEEEERRIRVKSVGNIRFVGELFKQNMINFTVMHQCIRHLLNQIDEESLECLCKLLTTVGKVLESKNPKGTESFVEYFKQMQNIANRKGKISSRIRFMLQDVIDLRANKWVPRRDDSNPKTMDQIQKEAEFERQEIQLNSNSLNTPRKDDRVNERKRNRGGSGSTEEGGWSLPVGRSRQVYSVETAKLKNKPPAMDDMQLGSRSTYQWSRPNPKMMTLNKYSCLENKTSEPERRVPNIHLSGSRSIGSRDYNRVESKSSYDDRNSRNCGYQLPSTSSGKENSTAENTRSQSLSCMNVPRSTTESTVLNNALQLSDEALHIVLNKFLEDYVAGEEQIEEAGKEFRMLFPVSSHVSFVHETINAVLEKSEHHRNKVSQLFTHLLSDKCISFLHFKKGFEKILEAAGDLIIDIPKLWKYFAKILVHPVLTNTYPLSELKFATQCLPLKLQEDGCMIELIAEIFLEIKKLNGVTQAATYWSQSDLQWNDLIDNHEKVDKVLKQCGLDWLTKSSCTNLTHESISVLNTSVIHETLLELLKDSNFDQIKNWIQEHVGDNVKEPKFIRTLMTSVLESSVEQCNDKWTFKVENFDKSKKLIQRYVDADADLELQCLFALQAYVHSLEHPAGLIQRITNYLCENNLVSNEAFLAWENNDNPAERDGKSIAMFSLKSFFTPLKEAEISSGEEAES